MRIIKASRILLLEPVHHVLHDLFRREDLIGALGRNKVKDVSLVVRLKIICKLGTFFHKLLHGIVKHDLVKQVSVKVLLFTAFRHIVPAVTQHTELIQGYALPILRINGDLPEHLIRHEGIKVCKRGILITISHEERRNGTRETTQMVTDATFDRILLCLQLFGLYRFDDGFRSLFHRLLAMELLMNVADHITVALETSGIVLLMNLRNFRHRSAGTLCLMNFVIMFLGKLIVPNRIIAVRTVDDRVGRLLDFALQLILRGLSQIAAILRPCGIHQGVRNRP